MDPRDRADALLARARARRAYIVTPEDATSPMDAMNTLQIPRSVVQAAESSYDEHEVTMSIPAPGANRVRAAITEVPAESTPFESIAIDVEDTEPPTGPIPTLSEDADEDVEDEPRPRAVEGLIPTIQEPGARKNSLVDRLRGHD